MWDEITYPFQNLNGAAVEVWKWVSNFIPYFTGMWACSPYAGIKVNPC